MNHSLRPIHDNDRAPLYAIHVAAMRDYVTRTWGWDDNVQRDFWRRTAHDGVQVIELDGQIVGFLDVVHHEHIIDIVNIELSPAVQGRGIGTALLQHILDEADEARKDVQLQVLKVNPRARALYERLEFTPAGETEHHILMKRAHI